MSLVPTSADGLRLAWLALAVASLGVVGVTAAESVSTPPAPEAEAAMTGAVAPAAKHVALRDLDGRAVQPFALTNAAAFVFVFIRNDCPIANRYAPELRRIDANCRRRGVAFWLIHPLHDESPVSIREHAREYRLPGSILRDEGRVLSRLAGITVTPEAAIYDRTGALRYRGRIDDRFPALGRQRLEATRHDLLEALDAMLQGKPVIESRTPAVGCVLPTPDEEHR